MRNSSYRRHHDQRIKEKVKEYHRGWASKSNRARGIVSNTPAMCSCYLCGNPRKHFNEKTIQEKISDINFQEQLNEIKI